MGATTLAEGPAPTAATISARISSSSTVLALAGYSLWVCILYAHADVPPGRLPSHGRDF
jgi:hypothetical protein